MYRYITVERARMLSVLRARLATLLRTEEARMRESFVKLMHQVKRDGGGGAFHKGQHGGGGGGRGLSHAQNRPLLCILISAA